ncbi:MAG: amidohydrolase family protein [Synergistaceae bacterium]|jgi:predicted amidohydrolase|nr:amidohydrolase family protein [Synergistaceae bacterium]
MICSYRIKNGRVLDPAKKCDQVKDIYIRNTKIVEAPDGEIPKATEEVDASGCLVLPGLIDFHCHINYGHSEVGILPDVMTFPNAVTTAVDAGSAGTANFEGFYRDAVCSSLTTIKSFINVTVMGIASYLQKENYDVSTWDIPRLEYILERYTNNILGIKQRIGKEFGSFSTLVQTKKIAKLLAQRINVHVVGPEQAYNEILPHFDKNDILSHCYQAKNGPHTILDNNGKICTAAKEARARGVFFDAAAGRTLYNFNIIQKALEDDFLPDIISSDASSISIFKKSLHSILYVMSMYLALGMPLNNVIRAVTDTPAKLIGMEGQVGTLAPGAAADVVILKIREKSTIFQDSHGNTILGSKLFIPQMTIKAGRTVFRQIDFTF